MNESFSVLSLEAFMAEGDMVFFGKSVHHLKSNVMPAPLVGTPGFPNPTITFTIDYFSSSFVSFSSPSASAASSGAASSAGFTSAAGSTTVAMVKLASDKILNFRPLGL